jgi:hypothetical protein
MGDELQKSVEKLVRGVIEAIQKEFEILKKEQPLAVDEVRPAIYTPYRDPYNPSSEPVHVLVHVSRKPKYDGQFVCETKEGRMRELSEYCLQFLDTQEKFNEVFDKLKKN